MAAILQNPVVVISDNNPEPDQKRLPLFRAGNKDGGFLIEFYRNFGEEYPCYDRQIEIRKMSAWKTNGVGFQWSYFENGGRYRDRHSRCFNAVFNIGYLRLDYLHLRLSRGNRVHQKIYEKVSDYSKDTLRWLLSLIFNGK